MIKDSHFKNVLNRFHDNCRFLKSLESKVNKLEDSKIVIKLQKLAAAASRVNVPEPFRPYIKIIEKRLNRPFPENLRFTAEEVRSEDKMIISDFSISNFDFSKLNISYLIEAAITAMSELGISPNFQTQIISAEDSAQRYPNNTSSGYPIFKRKDDPLSRDDAIKWANASLLKPDYFKEFSRQPTAVFHRFQYKARILANLTEMIKKIRPVWGVSYRILVYEGMLFRFIEDAFVSNNIVKDIPPTTAGLTRAEISDRIIVHVRGKRKNIISVDYSRFDSFVASFMWALFYAVLWHCFQNTSVTNKNLETMMSFHCYTPYCWNSTQLKFQRRGVPSGCLVTSFFDTWVNRTIINYAFLERSGGKFTAQDRSFCLGDDLLFVEEQITLKHFLNVARRFGMLIIPEKCSTSSFDKPFNFLGYTWDTLNRPVQPQEWYIAHYCLPSRFYRDYPFPVSVLQTYRALSLSMGLYQGIEMFESLIGSDDFIWVKLKEDWERGLDTIITYVGSDMRKYGLKIPLSVILTEGWRAF